MRCPLRFGLTKSRSFGVFLLVAGLLWMTSATTFAMQENPPVSAADLTCEYLHNPEGIDAPRPRLSWILRSFLHNQRQSAYHAI